MRSDLRRLLRELDKQGFRTEKTRSGLRFVPPQQGRPVVHVHGSPSDWRAMRNVERDLRAAGYRPPGDSR